MSKIIRTWDVIFTGKKEFFLKKTPKNQVVMHIVFMTKKDRARSNITSIIMNDSL